MSNKQKEINKMKRNIMRKYFSPQQNNAFSADSPTPYINTDTYMEPRPKAERTDAERFAFMQQKREQSEAIRRQENSQESFKESTFSALTDNFYQTKIHKVKIRKLVKTNQSLEKNIKDMLSRQKEEKNKRSNLKRDIKQLQKDIRHLHADIKEIKSTLILINRYLNVSAKKVSFHDLAPDLKYALAHSQK